MVVVGAVESAVGQALALGKTPFDLLRGSGGEEKVLKNAKDACATEALEIATYTSLEQLARSGGAERAAQLAGAPPRGEGRGWRPGSARTRRRCSSASCVSCPSSRRPWSAPTSSATRPTT